MKGIGKFILLYFAMVAFVYGIVPLGIAAFIAGKAVYGSWEAALAFYGAHMCIAATSIVALVPVYGNKLHYLIATNYIFPWATSNGVGPSWLLSLSGLFSGILAAMCPGALVFHVIEALTGSPVMPRSLLILFGVIIIAGSIYSGMLFFGG
ncbi:MAG: hypothetical protein ACE5I9_01320 [Candidatus Methylomirabilales bacterium]